MSQQWRSEKPAAGEHAPYYGSYVAEATGRDLVEELERQGTEVVAMLKGTPESRGGFRYAPGKWSLREVVLHMTDAERVFGFRLIWFARGGGELPGFDENAWVTAGGAEQRTIADLAAEFAAVRKATIAMIKPLEDDVMLKRGVANGKEISCRALAWVMAGHVTHHEQVLRQRYLVSPVSVPPPTAVVPD